MGGERRTITEEQRQRLGLNVGRRVIGYPLTVRCGNNLIERKKDGELSIWIGYFLPGQTLSRRLWAEGIAKDIEKKSILHKLITSRR